MLGLGSVAVDVVVVPVVSSTAAHPSGADAAIAPQAASTRRRDEPRAMQRPVFVLNKNIPLHEKAMLGETDGKTEPTRRVVEPSEYGTIRSSMQVRGS